MIIEVRNADNNELVTSIKARINTKNTHSKVKSELSKMVGHEVRLLAEGRIDMRTRKFEGHYLTLGTMGDVKKIYYNVIQ